MTRPALIAMGVGMVALAHAGPELAVNGRPICGSFAVRWEPDELRQAQEAGINLVFCYERPSNTALLDPETELGRIALEGGTGVLANFLRYAGGARLLADLAPEDMLVRMSGVASLPDSGTLVLDDELIEYEGKQEAALVVLQRGARGTVPATHAEGTFLFEESALIEHLDSVKHSPTLWGFWVLDDRKGEQATALRNFTRIVREHDVDEDGEPLGHAIIAGFANMEALANFTEDCCDAAGVYIYPSRKGAHQTWLTHDLLREMVPLMRERDPDAKFIGIYQAFHAPKWQPKPTPAQVRQQVNDFLHWGASGLMAYSWHMIEGATTLNTMDDLRAEVTQIATDLREGRLQVDRVPPRVEPVAEFTSAEGPSIPVLHFEEGAALPASGRPLAAELAPVDGEEGSWLHLHFARYEDGGDQWPGIRFVPSEPAMLLRDWSAFGGLVVRVRNMLSVPSEIGVVIAGPVGMWARYYPLPASVATDVALDLREVALSTPIERISRISLIMRRPPVETHLAVEGAWLTPLRLAVTPDDPTAVPAIATETPGDGDWTQAAVVALSDATGTPAVKPCSVRLARSAEALHIRFDCAAPDPEVLRARSADRDADMAGEDTVQVLLRAEGSEQIARLRVNALGTVRDELIGPSGADLAWDAQAVVSSEIDGGIWRVQITMPLTSMPGGDSALWHAAFSRGDTELRPLAWPAERVPGGAALGSLRLDPE